MGPLLLIMCGYEVVGPCVDVGLVTCGPSNPCVSNVSRPEKAHIASKGGYRFGVCFLDHGKLERVVGPIGVVGRPP